MQSFTRTHRTALPACVICYLLLTTNTGAQIVTDGSVGAAQNLSGPDFSIPETLGTTVGANLFHSFEQFNILTGQSATFSGASEIANVISRVTGGAPSTIDGTLRSTIGQADFYFLNPAGVLFGPNAQVDVPGSFYVSTADQLRFADGSTYTASIPAASTLSFNEPASFGFLGDQTATISVVGSKLVLTPGKTLSLTAGELELGSAPLFEGARLFIERGDIQLVATGDAANTVTIDGNPSVPARGELSISDTIIEASGDGAGRIVIRGGESRIKAGIRADNLGPTDAGSEKGIFIHATSLDLPSSTTATDAFGQGDAADISVIVAGDLSISALLTSGASEAGDAGQVRVRAGTMTVDGRNNDFLTGIVSTASFPSSANVGTVTVIVDNTLSIVNGATIESTSFDSTGRPGQVNVTAGSLTIDGQGSDFTTGITSRASLNSGTVTLAVDNTVSIVDGGSINTNSFDTNDGGQVSVTAGAMRIDGQGSREFTGISSRAISNSTGNAGTVTVNVADAVSIVNGGRIDTNTLGAGDAGEVNVMAGTLTVDGPTSAIVSIAGAGSSGQAGNIRLDTQNLAILNSGIISIESQPTVDAAALATIQPTEININAQNVSLTDASITTESFGNVPAGSISLNVADILSLDPSRISTAANNANGGAISINAKVIDLQDSQITTSVSGRGDGGDIDLNAKVLVLDGGFIQANTAGANARGGDIRINTDALVASQNLLITGGSTPIIFQPGLNVIQAAAPDGVSGSINITSPQLDISGDLTDLEAELLDIDQLAQDPCSTPGAQQSRLAKFGRGGLPESPEQTGSVVIDSDRLQRLLPDIESSTHLRSASTQSIATRHSTLSIEPLWLSAYAKTEC